MAIDVLICRSFHYLPFFLRFPMKLNLRTLCITSSLAVVVSLAGTAFADPVTNGTFSSDLTGWTTTGSGTTPGQGITVINFGPDATPYGDNIPNAPGGTSTGVYFVDDNANETLSQTLTLAAHTTYDLTFDLFATDSGAGNPFNFTLTDSVGAIASSAIASSSLSAGVWTLETLQFTTGSATSYDLDFNFVSGPTPAKDVVLTNVAVTSPVPEPSSFLLLGSGLLVAAGVVRRRLS